MPPHRLLEALHVAVDVAVEQLEEEAEVLRVALVRRRRHQEVVVGHRRQRLAELVGERLLVGAVGGHLVRLVDDDEVPAAAEQALLGVLDARDPGDRRDDLVLLLPRVLAVVGAEHVAADRPRTARGTCPSARAATGSERFAGVTISVRFTRPRIFSSLSSRPAMIVLPAPGSSARRNRMRGSLQEVVVDRLELVRQRVDAGDGEREVGVVLVGEAEAHGLDAEAEARRVAVERLALGRRVEDGRAARGEDALVDLSGLLARADDLDSLTERRDDEHLDRLGKTGPRTMLPA